MQRPTLAAAPFETLHCHIRLYRAFVGDAPGVAALAGGEDSKDDWCHSTGGLLAGFFHGLNYRNG